MELNYLDTVKEYPTYISSHGINKCEIAIVAFELAFRMNFLVRLQTGIKGERRAALFALQRLLASVGSRVHFERVRLSEYHAAPLADERLRFHVRLLMKV